ncbi:hypothetical protein TNCV_1749721 [Trichonephila clavipes]|nr:hypothetical protein TNCV_1749721 [Trichonephila clavipes]
MLQPLQARLPLILTIWYSQPRGNSLSSTDQSQCLLSSSSSQQSTLVSSSDSHVIPPPTPYHTSSTTFLQPANQVASCSPTRIIPLPQATLTIRAMGRRNAPRSMFQ